MTDHWKKHRGEVSISPLMQRLRDELDAAGIEWHDASEEFGWDESNSGGDPEPRAIEDIVATVKEDWDR